MGIRSVSCVILLISLVVTNARTMELVSRAESVSSACDKCLLISRKAETTLNSSKLFDEARKLSGEACDVFPTIVQEKCLKKSGAYMHEARLVFQEFFEESHLCNGSGLCATSEPPVDNGLLVNEIFDELVGGSSCTACQKVMGALIYRLKHRRMKKKIVHAMMDYCEEQHHEDRCKRAVHQYGLVVLNHLEKFNSSELCSKIEMCGDKEMAMKLYQAMV